MKLIPEILALCSACSSESEVVGILRTNQSPALRTILQLAFHPDVVFDTTIPVWKKDPNPIGLSPNSLFNEARRLYLFTEAKKLPKQKKSELLLLILESVHPSEAYLVESLLSNKGLGVDNLTYQVVETAFPNLLPKRV